MDFNAGEIVLLVVLAVIIFGPEKLPDLARKTARVFTYLRNVANDARTQLREELGDELAGLNLRDLNPKTLLADSLLTPQVREDLAGIRGELADAARAFSDAASGPGEAGASSARPARIARAKFDPEAT